jgi:DNA-binding GntR family transcriptional regulator
MSLTIDNSTTRVIVAALTKAMIEHRLKPGTKLGEQKLATQFGVSRTLIRQALFQLSQKHLVLLEPARGAFVSAPSIEEARQVFEVRRMLETAMISQFVDNATLAHFAALRSHLKQERAAIAMGDVAGRTELLGDFHVYMAKLLGNKVLAELLEDLISRCALITLMYQSATAAEHSVQEHADIIKAVVARNKPLAIKLMHDHLSHVEASLTIHEINDQIEADNRQFA